MRSILTTLANPGDIAVLSSPLSAQDPAPTFSVVDFDLENRLVTLAGPGGDMTHPCADYAFYAKVSSEKYASPALANPFDVISEDISESVPRPVVSASVLVKIADELSRCPGLDMMLTWDDAVLTIRDVRPMIVDNFPDTRVEPDSTGRYVLPHLPRLGWVDGTEIPVRGEDGCAIVCWKNAGGRPYISAPRATPLDTVEEMLSGYVGHGVDLVEVSAPGADIGVYTDRES